MYRRGVIESFHDSVRLLTVTHHAPSSVFTHEVVHYVNGSLAAGRALSRKCGLGGVAEGKEAAGDVGDHAVGLLESGLSAPSEVVPCLGLAPAQVGLEVRHALLHRHVHTSSVLVGSGGRSVDFFPASDLSRGTDGLEGFLLNLRSVCHAGVGSAVSRAPVIASSQSAGTIGRETALTDGAADKGQGVRDPDHVLDHRPLPGVDCTAHGGLHSAEEVSLEGTQLGAHERDGQGGDNEHLAEEHP
mmetsp:Transcript_34867/g.68840  ORF Transcript_34867/g.68840 Transcript_34867/m.68840 type:complete len:244 (+) Transcript_34867:331-1062(+)